MKRALLVGVLLIALFAVFSYSAPHALAWGPCDGKYGGYAGCSMKTGYDGSYWKHYGFVYNRVCFWHWSWKWGWHKKLVCTFVKVPAWPVSGVYGGFKIYGGSMGSGGGGYGGY